MRLSDIPADVLRAALAAVTPCGATTLRYDDGIVDWERSALHHCTEKAGHQGWHRDGDRTWER